MLSCARCGTIMVSGGKTKRQKEPPQCYQHQDGRREVKRMRYHSGVWHFRGRKYATLHDALLSVWP